MRFSILLKNEKFNLPEDARYALPYQEAMGLNNITVFYLPDLFIYWFYRPFASNARLLRAIAMARVGDAIPLGVGLGYLAYSRGGLWSFIFTITMGWCVLCLGYLLFKEPKLLKSKFLQIFGLSLLAWVLEWVALSLAYMVHRGLESEYFTLGLKGIFNSYILGPQFMYQWFFLVHFILGFASLLLVSYRKE